MTISDEMADLFFTLAEPSCPESCKCQKGDSTDGGKEVDAEGYCNYFCSKGGYCGAFHPISESYTTSRGL